MQELNKYIEIVLILENRNKNFTVFEQVYQNVMMGTIFELKEQRFKYEHMKRILYPMRVCTAEDFTSRGYAVSEAFAAKLQYRVCPDIRKDDPHYKVKNLYQNKDERFSFSI
jgi:hypothetical protein